jgi:hypothetical protein
MNMTEELSAKEERGPAFWRRVYATVIAFTFFIVTALWAFSRYFS